MSTTLPNSPTAPALSEFIDAALDAHLVAARWLEVTTPTQAFEHARHLAAVAERARVAAAAWSSEKYPATDDLVF